MMKINILFLLSILLFSLKVKAQTLSQQFESTVTKSNNFQNYKVINQNQINTFWNNIKDSLQKSQTQINTLQQELKKNKLEISAINQKLINTQNNLTVSQIDVNSIAFLGVLNMSKVAYGAMMWGIVFILAAISGFLFYNTIAAKKEANHRINLFEEINKEFKNYKVNANEKEKKLARELQDERNKLEKS